MNSGQHDFAGNDKNWDGQGTLGKLLATGIPEPKGAGFLRRWRRSGSPIITYPVLPPGPDHLLTIIHGFTPIGG
jgi:hypothetical protein